MNQLSPIPISPAHQAETMPILVRTDRLWKPTLSGVVQGLMRLFPIFGILLSFNAFLVAEDRPQAPTGDMTLTWKVDGVTREALVHVPAAAVTKATPVIFAWHGHGGNMRKAAEAFGYHKLWPEAISVYAQGLNTPGRLTDPEGKKPGWQSRPGDQGDRDLKLFDAILGQLKRDYDVDQRRVFSTGHSNGGGFTYLLWETRGDQLAAVAPSSSAAARREVILKPLPAFHVAGKNDPLVKFEWQKAAMDKIREVNQCGQGRPWGGSPLCTEYESGSGHPFVACIHNGGHEFLPQAPGLIVKFFKAQLKPVP